MIERLIESSIRNRFLVLFLAAALAAWAVYAVLDTPVDAVPDLGENQVIVFTDWPGRSPREIEDQISYPLSRKLQGLAGVRVVRSSSEFNFSMITVIFEDNVDYYFARQRVLEKLTLANTFLPPGVVPYLAPGVAEVATVGGAPLEYQVDVRPEALRAYGVTLGDLYAAVAKSNLAVGGRVVQKNNAEYLVRGVGWIADKKDIE